MNNPDSPPPHPPPGWGQGEKAVQIFPDGVPSPWVLQYSLANFTDGIPPDAKKYAQKAYNHNSRKFLLPAKICQNPVGRDLILRCLDGGRKGGADTGYGRAEVGTPWSDMGPAHLRQIFDDVADKDEDSREYLQGLQERCDLFPTDTFHSRRLYKLLEEKEIVWQGGKLDVRKMSRGGRQDGKADSSRGHFPYVDEQASLIDDLQLREILRLRHRINRRRHFKWIAIRYQYKRWHSQYLRRRSMMLDEVKSRMGVMRQLAGA